MSLMLVVLATVAGDDTGCDGLFKECCGLVSEVISFMSFKALVVSEVISFMSLILAVALEVSSMVPELISFIEPGTSLASTRSRGQDTAPKIHSTPFFSPLLSLF